MMTSEQVELMFGGEVKDKLPRPKRVKEDPHSHRTKIEKKKKERRLPELNITDANNYVPNLTYFHCIAKKGISSLFLLQTPNC